MKPVFELTIDDMNTAATASVAALPKKWTADRINLYGAIPYSWNCVDCGYDTAPGDSNAAELAQAFAAKGSGAACFGPDTEKYIVRDKVWAAAGMEPGGGCLCIGCLETRLGRRLTYKDFPKHVFHTMPCSERLRSRLTKPKGLLRGRP